MIVLAESDQKRVDESLHKYLHQFFGFDSFKGQQETIIKSASNDTSFIL